VAPTPWAAAQASQALAGKTISEATADEVARTATAGATPLSHNGYKVQLVRVAVRRALLEATRGRA
jgi:xanthine dehydrogenase YagS FAD-binding subunit